MNKIITGIFLMMSTSILYAQQVIPLYDGEIPNAKPCNEKDHEFIDTSWMKSGILVVDHITKPTLTVFEPAAKKRKGNGRAAVRRRRWQQHRQQAGDQGRQGGSQ